MKRNMGAVDRSVRVLLVAPALLVVAVLVGLGTLGGVVATALALVMLTTAAIGFCPLYVPLHVHTDRRPGASA